MRCFYNSRQMMKDVVLRFKTMLLYEELRSTHGTFEIPFRFYFADIGFA